MIVKMGAIGLRKLAAQQELRPPGIGRIDDVPKSATAPSQRTSSGKGDVMNDFLVFGGFLVFWIVLNRWLLPYFGIQTCMSGACSRPAQTQPINLPDKPKNVGPRRP